MSPRRLALVFLLASALPAGAETRSASFGITVRVVRRPVASAAPATTFVGTATSTSIPCGVAGSTACGVAVAAARASASGSVVQTTFPDGAPTAVVER